MRLTIKYRTSVCVLSSYNWASIREHSKVAWSSVKLSGTSDFEISLTHDSPIFLNPKWFQGKFLPKLGPTLFQAKLKSVFRIPHDFLFSPI